MESIIIALISAGFPVIATAITAYSARKRDEKHSARDAILQLILEDHVAVMEGHLPVNYTSVLHEFDTYKKNGGNSYVEKKVHEYEDWFASEELKNRRKK